MAIETTKHPYELLVRWREGKITGAHVGFELTTTEDGKVISVSPLPVMSVDIGKGKGFPLKDILAQVNIDALTDRDAAHAEKATALTEKAAAIAERDTEKAEREKHAATASTLTARVAELATENVKLREDLAKKEVQPKESAK